MKSLIKDLTPVCSFMYAHLCELLHNLHMNNLCFNALLTSKSVKISLHEHLQIHVCLLLKLCMHMHVDLCRRHPQIVTVSLEIKSCYGEVLRKYNTLLISCSNWCQG